LGTPTGPLRIDPWDLRGASTGGIPLYVPTEPESAGKEAGSAKPTPTRQKDLFDPYEVDSPPKPRHQIPPLYPRRALRKGIEGYATLKFTVDEKGKVRDIRVAEWGGSREFGKAAVAALRKWTFTPGRRRGKPVAVRCRLRFTFQEED
jgi:TonB family protein